MNWYKGKRGSVLPRQYLNIDFFQFTDGIVLRIAIPTRVHHQLHDFIISLLLFFFNYYSILMAHAYLAKNERTNEVIQFSESVSQDRSVHYYWRTL